jgi:osmotically inducible protein OsmC
MAGSRISTSTAEWNGNLKQGSGRMKVGKTGFEGPFTYATRFETAAGTNPEELIAAAHAGCFSMQFSDFLAASGHTAKSVRTSAKVHMDEVGGGHSITRIELITEGDVPGISEAEFKKHAEAAKEKCPVSRALKAVPITVQATLKSS